MKCRECGHPMIRSGTYPTKKCRMQVWRCMNCSHTKALPVERRLLQITEKGRQEIRNTDEQLIARWKVLYEEALEQEDTARIAELERWVEVVDPGDSEGQ